MFPTSNPLLDARKLVKRFTLHTQGGSEISVLEGISLQIYPGEGVSLTGASGTGKSTLMRCLYGNYRVNHGEIWIRHRREWVDLVRISPQTMRQVRLETLGYVSQFLRVIPRVSALQVVAEPLLDLGWDHRQAWSRAEEILAQLNLPERLWSLSPTTFSGGEKQRINLARALLSPASVLLLDEPTSALDPTHRQRVVTLLQERQQAGVAVIGIFHDEETRRQICNRELNLEGQVSPA